MTTAPLDVARRNARRVVQEVRARRLRGDVHEDPICGGRFSALLPTRKGRPNAWCPRCGSAERHRLLWLYLERETTVLREPVRVLHMAAEPGLSRRLSALPTVDYTSADLFDTQSTVRADITDLPFEDGSFDVVLCNHVLEHIDDDRLAMRELARVLAPGGQAIMQHPVDTGREHTYEDPSVTDPAERDRLFFQHDHLRVYGRDFSRRLQENGFSTVERHSYQERLTPQERLRYRTEQLPSARPERDVEADVVYVCR